MDELVRYSVQWYGPAQPICSPMPDGYWTPWHVATAEIDDMRAERDRLRTQLAEVIARAERAEANAANWEEQANDRVSDWDEVRAERDALKLRLAAVEDMNAACNADFSRLRAERDALRARLDIRYDTAEGQPAGYGEDEIDRLRAAIETAPHAPHCLGSVALGRPSAYPCNCWKRAALKEEK